MTIFQLYVGFSILSHVSFMCYTLSHKEKRFKNILGQFSLFFFKNFIHQLLCAFRLLYSIELGQYNQYKT